MRFPVWLNRLLIFLFILGVVFRFVNLNHKVYWHDEVYTSFRAAGFTRDEIDQELFQNHVIPAQDLQKFLKIKPGSTAVDTLRSLAVEDPQHPPLYFLLTRWWMQTVGQPLNDLFHSPVTGPRSLSVLLSLLALPAMYALAWEVFASHSVGLLATTLLALSPFDVLFAQTARQYGLLTVMVITSSFLFLRAIRLIQSRANRRQSTTHRRVGRELPDWVDWLLYGLAVVIGLYTHPFFALTIAAHLVYVHALVFLDPFYQLQQGKILKSCWLSLAGAIAFYMPWLIVMVTNQDRALATTDWSQVFPGYGYLLKLWTLSFSSLFFDLDFGYFNPWTVLARIPVLILIAISLVAVCRGTNFPTWLFILASLLVPFLLLAVPDVLFGNKRSAVSRYLISCYPAVQLAVAYFLTTKLSVKTMYSGRSPSLVKTPSAYTLSPKPYDPFRRTLWRTVLGAVLLSCVTSLTVSALSFTWWNKDLSVFNRETADLVNRYPDPTVISDIGNDFTNTGDLISLSCLLNDQVRLFLLADPEFITTPGFSSQLQGRTAIAFRPSRSYKKVLEQNFGNLTRIHEAERLWKIAIPETSKPQQKEDVKRKIK